MKLSLTAFRHLSAAALLVALPSSAASPDASLVLRHADGTSVSLPVAQLRSLTFSYSDRTFTAHYSDGTPAATYDYAAAVSLSFRETTSVAPVVAEPSASVRVFSVDGTLVGEGSEDSVTATLAPGIYIVADGVNTHKLLVR